MRSTGDAGDYYWYFEYPDVVTLEVFWVVATLAGSRRHTTR